MTLPMSSVAAILAVVCLAVANSSPVQPVLPSPPVVRSVTTTSVTISWDDWIAGVHVGDPSLVGYVVHYKETGAIARTSYNRMNPLHTNETIGNLLPDTDYTFSVSVESSAAGRGPSKNVNATTSCGPPRGVLTEVLVHQVSSPRELHVTWERPLSDFKRLDPNCRTGGFANATIYYCSVADNRESGNQQSVSVPVNLPGGYYLRSLKPGSEYHVSMTLSNKDSEGPQSDLVSGTTAKRPRSTATVAWILFGITLAILVAFVIFVLCYCERLN